MVKRYRVKERVIIYARSNMKSITYSHAWAKPGFITSITGWDGEKLRQARDQKLVKYEKREDGFWYDINSIPERLLIKK